MPGYSVDRDAVYPGAGLAMSECLSSTHTPENTTKTKTKTKAGGAISNNDDGGWR